MGKKYCIWSIIFINVRNVTWFFIYIPCSGKQTDIGINYIFIEYMNKCTCFVEFWKISSLIIIHLSFIFRKYLFNSINQVQLRHLKMVS